MSGPSQIGVSSDVTSGEQSAINALVGIAGKQQNEASQLFSLGLPAETAATNYYETLASGDPAAIARATAPAAQQINQATTSANQNILQNAPAGGEKNLAIEQNQVNQGAEIGKVASQGYLGSFGALGQLGSQTTGQSAQAVSQALSGLGAGLSGYGQVGNQQLQSQQLQVQEKGEQLGFWGSLAGAGGQAGGALGGAAILACWCAAELFNGWFDPRTVLVRRWVNFDLPQSWIGRRLHALYLRFGQRLAVRIRTDMVTRRAVMFVFNRALAAARRVYGSGPIV